MKQLTCLVFLTILALIRANQTLIIDTDAGADDAMAIILALNNVRGYDILGITTVKGNSEVYHVTNNVLKILDVAGFLGNVDVYNGSATALVKDRENSYPFGKDGLGDFDYGKDIDASKYVSNVSAPEFLADVVKQNPDNITVLCLGPLTNIALASRLNPDFFTQVKQILMVGGSMSGSGTMGENEDVEYNMYMDPEAAMVVFSQIPYEKPAVLLTFDSLQRTPVPMSFRVITLAELNTDIMNFLNKAEEKSLTGNDWLCYDPSLATLVNDWDISTKFVVGTPIIESDGRMTLGPGSNVAFITDFNSTRLQKDILTYLEDIG